MEKKSIHIPRNVVIPVKTRLRFREEDDLNLLREVAGQNPFENSSVWEIIRYNIYILSQKAFSIKTLKDHLDLLIKAWLEKVKSLKNRSGIEEDYSEKDQLCQNINDYMIQFRQKPGQKRKCLSQDKILGKSARDEWTSKLANKNVESFSQVSNTIENDKENDSLQDHMYYSLAEIEFENTLEIKSSETTIDDLNQPNFRAGVTPKASDTQNIFIENNNPLTPIQSKVLRPIKTRKRKVNVQRQGINYLEKYDQEQRALKEIENKLEEKRIAIEEKKCALEETRLSLEDRRLNLQEKKLELEIEKENYRFNPEKEKQILEIEEKN